MKYLMKEVSNGWSIEKDNKLFIASKDKSVIECLVLTMNQRDELLQALEMVSNSATPVGDTEMPALSYNQLMKIRAIIAKAS